MPCTQIDVVELPDGEGGDRIREHTFRGPIQQQLREALQYLENNVLVENVVKRPDTAEAERFYNYPFAALEEALSNAVYHKGYDFREPIEVRVLADRVEILSYPGADRSISIEGLKEYRAVSRRYRNRRVGEFLKELHLTEGRNTGIHKILRALRENGSPDPVFETDESRSYFLTTLYARKADVRTPAERASLLRESPSEHRARSIEERRDKILRYLSENPDARLQDASQNLEIARGTLDRDIRLLKEMGLLYREGTRASGQWRVGS